MKHRNILIIILTFTLSSESIGQGWMTLTIGGPFRTRLYHSDGDFAGPSILGQFLIGTDPDMLEPFLNPYPHYEGSIAGGAVQVPGIAGREIAYVQLVAWDSNLWGNELEAVPSSQRGQTDIISHMLTSPPTPIRATAFNQPAIVPIPEPSTWALGLVGLSVFLFAGARKRRRSHPLTESKPTLST